MVAFFFAVFLGSQSPSLTEPSKIEFRIDPLANLYFWVRSLTTEESEIPKVAHLPAAVLAARRLEQKLGHPLFWGKLDALLPGQGNCDEFLIAAQTLPNELRTRKGTLAFRSTALEFLTALQKAEPAYREKIWPLHRKDLQRTIAQLELSLLPKQTKCLQEIVQAFGMEDPGIRIPVYLTRYSPPPGGVTLRSGATGVCFVGTDKTKADLLIETILHEAIHALDLATGNQNHLLNQLRREFERAGLTANHPLTRNYRHTLFFLQAESTVRSQINPGHSGYGTISGYYAKLRSVAEFESAQWKLYQREKICRDQLVKALTDHALQSLRESLDSGSSSK